MRKSRAMKNDGNQSEIVEALRAVGATVQTLDHVDLLIGFHGMNYLMEIKNPDASAIVIKESQVKLLDEWEGQYDIVFTKKQALKLIGAI